MTPGRRIAVGGSVLGAAIVLALLAPLLVADPVQQSLIARLRPPAWALRGSWQHPLGTDAYGRDLLARLVYGARVSMLVGIASMLLSCAAGTLAGMVAGYRGGRTETVVMRLADAHMAFPEILLAILVAAAFGPSLFNLVLVLGVSSWMVYARVAFGLTRSLRERPFVEAAVAQGARGVYILRRHILPQLMPTLTVVCTLQVGQMILTEAALSFLGLGVQPPTPSWGNILAEGRDRLFAAPWIADSAGLAVIAVVWAINTLGNGLRDRLDPLAKA